MGYNPDVKNPNKIVDLRDRITELLSEEFIRYCDEESLNTVLENPLPSEAVLQKILQVINERPNLKSFVLKEIEDYKQTFKEATGLTAQSSENILARIFYYLAVMHERFQKMVIETSNRYSNLSCEAKRSLEMEDEALKKLLIMLIMLLDLRDRYSQLEDES
jgi:hypothetical protein